MKYNNKEVIRKMRDNQSLNGRVKLVIKNPNFTKESKDRLCFYNDKYHKEKVSSDINWTKHNTIYTLKEAWHNSIFPTEWTSDIVFTESSVLDASITLIKDPKMNYEQYRNVGYVYVEVDGFHKYYFVDTVSFLPNNEIFYALSLDSITTYLDRLEFNGDSKVIRKHYDRLVVVDGLNVLKKESHTSDLIGRLNLPSDNWPFNKGTFDWFVFSKNIDSKTSIDFKQTSSLYDVPFIYEDGFSINNKMSNNAFRIINGVFDNGQKYKVIAYTTFLQTGGNLVSKTTTFTIRILDNKIQVELSGDDPVKNDGTKAKYFLTPTIATASYVETDKGITYNLSPYSGVWNKEDLGMNAKYFKERLQSNKIRTTQLTLSDEQLRFFDDAFNFGTIEEPKYLYGLFPIPTGQLTIPGFVLSDWTDGVGMSTIIVPIAKENSSRIVGSSAISYNSNNIMATINNPLLIQMIATDEPLTHNFTEITNKAIVKSITGYDPTDWHDADHLFIIGNTNSLWDTDVDYMITNPILHTKHIKDLTLKQSFDIKNEPKLISEEFLNLKLTDASSDSKDLWNYKINTTIPFLEIDKYNLISPTITNKIYDLNKIYDGYTKDEQRLFITTNYDSVPNLSNSYKDYMKNHQTAFNTGLKQNWQNRIFGATQTGLSLSPFGVARAVLSSDQKEEMMNAQMEDLKRSGNISKNTDSHLLLDYAKERIMDYNNDIVLNIYGITQQQELVVAKHFNKYGYICNNIEHFTDYSQLSIRHRFSYWEIANFSKSIEKKFISNEILDDINGLFNDGITLWNIENENGEVLVNNYQEENWENSIAKLLN